MSKTLRIVKTKGKRKDIKYAIQEGKIIQETVAGYLIQKGNRKEFINKADIVTGDIEVKVG